MIQDLIKEQSENVKAIVLQVFKEQEACANTHRKGIAEMGIDSYGEGNNKARKEETATIPIPVRGATAPETSLPLSTFPLPAPSFIAQPHHYPPYQYYSPYHYPPVPPPQGYSQLPSGQVYPQPQSQPGQAYPQPSQGPIYSVNFFHH